MCAVVWRVPGVLATKSVECRSSCFDGLHPTCAQEWQNVFQIGGAALGGAIAPATGGSGPTTAAAARTTALAQVTKINGAVLQAPGWQALCRCHLLRCLTGLSTLDLDSQNVTGALFEMHARVDVGVRDVPASVC